MTDLLRREFWTCGAEMQVDRHPGMLFVNQAAEASLTAARQRIEKIVNDNAELLVSRFYSAFLSHAEASAFLSHSVVSERLSKSLHAWLLDLVRADPRTDMASFAARQVKIGEIHARINVPSELVMEGATLLKTEIFTLLIGDDIDAKGAIEAVTLLSELVDLAMRLMTSAYLSDTKQRVRTDEAFRLFSLGQDISLERETQRAALMEWGQEFLFNMLGQASGNSPSSLANSDFGLWVRHRAAVLFQGSSLLRAIEKLIAEVDQQVLTCTREDLPTTISILHGKVDEIKYLLNDLFQSATTIENGRDPLTRALNRRFLPSVLSREVAVAKSSKTPLSILMCDIDNFKSINDRHGHSVGDIVLGHTAETLLSNVRSSDFVFRYGGEEFLIVLVETDQREAAAIAERIRRDVAESPVNISNNKKMSITVSIGLASYEGHPDYQYLIDATDHALYRAKAEGRNRVALADT